MDCICGCGIQVRRGLETANLQASTIALELLVWDRARTEGRITREESPAIEGLIHRGSLQYRRLVDTIHGERETAPVAEGEAWLRESEAERRERQHMSERRWLRGGTKLRLTAEDVERLDRQHPERSFSGAPPETEGEAEAAAPEPASADADVVTQLERLGALHSEGVLSDEEFAAAKARLLG